jgi:hypothetical protein
MRFRLSTLLIVLAVIGVSFGLIRALFLAAAPHIRPSSHYGVRAEFTELPADDAALAEWLSNQPGVYRAFVNRESRTVRIVWGMSRDLNGNPPLPDLRSSFDRFGYTGLKRYEPN